MVIALAEVVASMAEETEAGHEAETLQRLLKLSAAVEHLVSTSAFRFGAAGAYEALVNQRIAALRRISPARVAPTQTGMRGSSIAVPTTHSPAESAAAVT